MTSPDVIRQRLEQAGWLDHARLDVLRQIVGFRNVLVHGYADVDLRIVHDVLEHRLGDLLHFAATVRRKLAD
ncbi:MAG: DUF86 domain-containing protein [Planctomycetes bacterium]|nr:DUF86 domain-containing protein [Planctomycetota bacterium]